MNDYKENVILVIILCVLAVMITLALTIGLPSSPNKPTYKVVQKDEISLIQSLDFDSEEAEMLMKIAVSETDCQNVEDMAKIMIIVLNRTWSEEYPNTINEVIHQPGAFKSVDSGDYEFVLPNTMSQEALDLVISGWNKIGNRVEIEY